MNKTLIIVVVLFASAFYGCDKKDSTILPPDNIIRLEFESDTAQLAANGVSLIRLKATIASNAEEAWRNVTFTVSDAASMVLPHSEVLVNLYCTTWTLF